MRIPKVQPIQPVSSTKSGIYLHFPYCLQKCHYCDFYSVGLDEIPGADFQRRLKEYESALLRELQVRCSDSRTPTALESGIARSGSDHSQQPSFSNQSFDTIYFGGGTSSLMPPDMIRRILQALQEYLDIDQAAEVTLEGNPENLNPEYLVALHEIGVNRVNSGLQTYNARFLKDMNRYHHTERYAELLETLVSSPIPRVGVDLIYGFHGQSYEDFLEDLNRVLEYPIHHLSVYSLTVEPETRYARNIKRGRQGSPEEKLQEKIFRELPEHLADRGWNQYEISNYAQGNAICLHNWKYWQYLPYLGLGPGAHGFDGYRRYANPRNLNAWASGPGHNQESELHDPIIDVFLNLFRITLPIDIHRIQNVWGEQGWSQTQTDNLWNALIKKLKSMENEGLCALSEAGIFQWTIDGLTMLDSHIEELIRAVQAADPNDPDDPSEPN